LELARARLGLQLSKEQKQAQDAEKKRLADEAKEQERSASKKMEDDPSRLCFHCKQAGHVYRDCPARLAAEEQGEVQQSFAQARRGQQNAEEKELVELLADEHIVTDQGEPNELAALTGRPLDDDRLMYALPHCAPYSALSDYKFKLKLMPGNSRKGAVTKTAIEVFSRPNVANPAQKALVRACDPPMWHAVLLSDVRVAAAGLHGAGKRRKGKGGRR
jgi:hypothetical protein